MKSNCFHYRSSKDQKLVGGMVHYRNYEEAAVFARSGLVVKQSPSGRLYFADTKGREVRVYLSVHPEHLPDGAQIQEALNKKSNESLLELLSIR